MPEATPAAAPDASGSWTSRKFILVLVGHAINLWLLSMGKLTPQEAMNNVLYLTGLYVSGNVIDSAAGATAKAISTGKVNISPEVVMQVLAALGLNGTKPPATTPPAGAPGTGGGA